MLCQNSLLRTWRHFHKWSIVMPKEALTFWHLLPFLRKMTSFWSCQKFMITSRLDMKVIWFDWKIAPFSLIEARNFFSYFTPLRVLTNCEIEHNKSFSLFWSPIFCPLSVPFLSTFDPYFGIFLIPFCSLFVPFLSPLVHFWSIFDPFLVRFWSNLGHF